MAVDLFDTRVLNRVVRDLDQPSSFLLDMFFTQIQTEESKEIHFDLDKSKPRITPFVSPKHAGKVMDKLGYETKTYAPAYAKDKREFDPDLPLKRQIGERIGGSLSPAARMQMAIRLALADQIVCLTRRENVMAAEALRLGQVTVEGDGHPTEVVDFGRDSGLTIALTSTDKWDDAASTPVDDLEEWATAVQDASGAVAVEVVMDPKAWKLFRKKDDVKALLDTRRGSASTMELGPMARGQGAAKARMVGFIGDFRIWVYNETYVDQADVTQKMLPDFTVLVGSSTDLEGVRAYGMIQDHKSGFTAQRMFTKSWEEEDPSVRWLMMQSAPLVVPYRVNACLAATVA